MLRGHSTYIKKLFIYVKILLIFLGAFSVFSALLYSKDNISKQKRVREVESLALFKTVKETINSLYLAVQNEISMIDVIASQSKGKHLIRNISSALQYGGFMLVTDAGRIFGYESDDRKMFDVTDSEHIAVIKDIAFNNSLVQHSVKFADDCLKASGQIIYHLPVHSLTASLKEKLIDFVDKFDFVLLDQNYNHIYTTIPYQDKNDFSSCQNISSPLDSNMFYFCKKDKFSNQYIQSFFTVLTLLIPVLISLILLHILRKLEKKFIQKLNEINNNNNNLSFQACSILDYNSSTRSSNYISYVTHELRTPLNVIIAFSEMIKDECLGPIDNKRYICYGKEIYNFGLNLLRTVDNVIDVTKSNSMLMIPQKELSDVVELFQRVLKQCRIAIDEKRIEIRQSITKPIPEIAIDREQIKRAFSNILRNAIKFSPENSYINVFIFSNNRSIKLVIEDFGPGMSVIDGLPQIEDSVKKKADGLGIGIMLSKSILKLNNGDLVIESQLCKGTKVTITFNIIGMKSPMQ